LHSVSPRRPGSSTNVSLDWQMWPPRRVPAHRH
jgi:hypothetical protein